jgi:KRAB domain-containing zinc finger protein
MKMNKDMDEVSKCSEPNSSQTNICCPYCSSLFSSQSSLHEHQKICHNYRCDHCPLTFLREIHLIRHVKSSHKEKLRRRLECDYCDKTFVAPCHLQQHERIHTKERPYECAVCLKRFAAKHNLTVHARIHNGSSLVYPCRFPPCHRYRYTFFFYVDSTMLRSPEDPQCVKRP